VSDTKPHVHSFALSDWPFADSVSGAAFTTTRVMRDSYPVLMVSHELDGDWQFLCGTTTEYANCVLMCLGCMFDRDRTLAEIADLPLGWQAERSRVGGTWERIPPMETRN
jgi:hypothetical protein